MRVKCDWSYGCDRLATTERSTNLDRLFRTAKRALCDEHTAHIRLLDKPDFEAEYNAIPMEQSPCA